MEAVMEEEVVVVVVFTVVVDSEAGATTVAATAAITAVIPPAAIAAVDEEIPPGDAAPPEVCAAIRHRHVAPAHPGLGPGRAEAPVIVRPDGIRLPAPPAVQPTIHTTAAAWRQLTSRGLPTVSFTLSEATTGRPDQQLNQGPDQQQDRQPDRH